MKRLVFMTIMAGLMSWVSCDRHDDVLPEKSIRDMFSSMYPGATDVEWDKEEYCWVVSFDTGSGSERREHEAWYANDGVWIKTETDISYSDVPQRIKDILSASSYGDAVVDDDVKFVETPEIDYYKFEIKYGSIDLAVKVDESGNVGIAGIER